MSKPTKTVNVRRRVGHAPTAAEIKEVVSRAEARKRAHAAAATAKTTAKKRATKKAGKRAAKTKARAVPESNGRGRRGNSKIDQLVTFLRGKPHTLDEISAKFGWLPHSARAAVTNAKDKLDDAGTGETIERVTHGQRHEYTIKKPA